MANYRRTIDESGRVVEWEDLRLKYKPPLPIKLLLVGESPPNPNTGKFFYEGGPLTRHTKAAFTKVFPDNGDLHVNEFLDCFRDMGCFLDDISLKPVAGMNDTDRNYTLLKELPDFIVRLKRHRPKVIVSFVKQTYFFVKYAVEEACLDLQPKSLPYPRYRNVAKYVDGLSEILTKETERGNLSRESFNS